MVTTRFVAWIVASAVVASAALAQGTPRRAVDGTLRWPVVGDWQTVFYPRPDRPDGIPFCMTANRARSPITEAQAMVGITLNSEATHVYVTYRGDPVAPGRTMQLGGDGKPILQAPILSDGSLADGTRQVMADLPGTALVDTLGPAMVRSRMLQVDAGGRRFTARLGSFSPVLLQLKACALTVQRLSAKR